MFRNIKGQERVIAFLQNTISLNRISQAYLFYGPEGVGKFTTALYFGMALNCHAAAEKRPCGVCQSCHKFLEYSSPDLIYIFPTPNMKISAEGEIKESSAYNEYLAYIENRKSTPWEKYYFATNAEIRRESILALQHKLEFSQQESRYRICLIEDADEMNSQTANAFLKTLEEPPSNTVIILMTTKLQSLLPTVVSRCQLVYFRALHHKVIEDIILSTNHLDRPLAKAYSRIAHGNLEQAIRLSNDKKNESRTLMLSLLEHALDADDLWMHSLASTSRDKISADLVNDAISHLCIWFDDLALLPVTPALLTNLDQKPLLERCRQGCPDLDERLMDSLLYLEDVQKRIAGNVNLALILINVYHHLKNLFHPEQKRTG
jgi:DNA polymerase-3 subunit delta'